MNRFMYLAIGILVTSAAAVAVGCGCKFIFGDDDSIKPDKSETVPDNAPATDAGVNTATAEAPVDQNSEVADIQTEVSTPDNATPADVAPVVGEKPTVIDVAPTDEKPATRLFEAVDEFNKTNTDGVIAEVVVSGITMIPDVATSDADTHVIPPTPLIHADGSISVGDDEPSTLGPIITKAFRDKEATPEES